MEGVKNFNLQRFQEVKSNFGSKIPPKARSYCKGGSISGVVTLFIFVLVGIRELEYSKHSWSNCFLIIHLL